MKAYENENDQLNNVTNDFLSLQKCSVIDWFFPAQLVVSWWMGQFLKLLLWTWYLILSILNYPQLVVSTAKYNRQLVFGTANYLVRKRRYLPKKQFLYGKGGTNNKFNFTTVPLVPQLVPQYRFFRRPIFYLFSRQIRLIGKARQTMQWSVHFTNRIPRKKMYLTVLWICN